MVKNLPAVQETHVWSLSQENPLEKRMATLSSIFAWRIPWIVYSVGSQRAGHDWAIFTFSHLHTHPTLWAVAHQTLLYMGFPRQECWSGLPCPPPGDLPDSRIKPASPEFPALQAGSLLLSHQGSPIGYTTIQNKNFKVWGNTNDIMRQDSN